MGAAGAKEISRYSNVNEKCISRRSYYVEVFNDDYIAACLFVSAAGTGTAFAGSKQAIEEASKTGRFLMLIFYKDKDAALDTMEKTINAFKPKSKKSFSVHKANVSDATEKEIVAKYVANAPLPLLLVFAPNGTITAGFPKMINGDQLNTTSSLHYSSRL